jgi:hypothetical protein
MTAARRQVTVEGGGVALPGDLTIPDDPSGLVLFAHGSGSSRHSPRNRSVAASLNAAGFCTLLFDLLTADGALDQVATLAAAWFTRHVRDGG